MAREWSERHIRDLVRSEWVKIEGEGGGGSGGYEWGTGTDKDLLFTMIKEKFGYEDALIAGRHNGAIRNFVNNESVLDPNTYETSDVFVSIDIRVTDCKPVEYVTTERVPYYAIGWNYEGDMDILPRGTAFEDDALVGVFNRYGYLTYNYPNLPTLYMEYGEQLIQSLFLDYGGTQEHEDRINIDIGTIMADKWTNGWGNFPIGQPIFGFTADTGEYFGFRNGGLWNNDYGIIVRNFKPDISGFGSRKFSGAVSGKIYVQDLGVINIELGPAE